MILCVHAHQPVGNFDWVFSEAYEKSYKPFFGILDKHPKISMSCHFSGCLLDWLEKHKPGFLQLLKKMSDRGQLEFLGGGYYEPIYGAIPRRDLIGQIEMMRGKIKAFFGTTPEGAWLTERVWDPGLVGPLKAARVDYTVLDDLHLEMAGVKPPVTGYYQTQEGRKKLDIFASMKNLRYLMPFRKAEEVLDFVRSQKVAPQDAMVFADDCEKFGLWPGTYDWTYKEGWLDRFFGLLEKENSIAVYTFSQFRKLYPPKEIVKIPHASYSEMMEWSGGHFYNFFKKYPESQYMRDRMWSVSGLVAKTHSKNGDTKQFEEVRAALYRAQCNCTYWHGVFGGLYLHHLRSAVFENLIGAEDILAKISDGLSRPKKAKIQKWKLASGSRWQIRQKKLVTFFNPHYGAALEELDSLPKPVNLMCNLQRHKEVYHDAVLEKVAGAESKPFSIHEMLGSKEKDLDKNLYYDTARRLSFLDHFFEEEIGLKDFHRSTYAECGDFIGKTYRAVASRVGGLERLTFERKGSLELNRKKFSIILKKTVEPVADARLKVRYEFKNPGPEEVRFVFGVEFNFSIGDPYAMKGISKNNVREWIFNDTWRGLRIRLSSSSEMNFLATPIETVSESESGLEKTYQELAVLLERQFWIKSKAAGEIAFELEVI